VNGSGQLRRWSRLPRFFWRRVTAYPLLALILTLTSDCPATTVPAPLRPAFLSTPRECPDFEDDAIITARVITAPSGAPATQHPGIDLWVQNRKSLYIVRIHFGDRGDGQNSCLSFNECKDTTELPDSYRVNARLAEKLLVYLRHRNFTVGKFISWGPPLPGMRNGSNCGDAFVQVVRRLGIASEALPDMQLWIDNHTKGKWAFQRGFRHPSDEFFQPDASSIRGNDMVSERASKTVSNVRFADRLHERGQ
jgi:hypothetical protein